MSMRILTSATLYLSAALAVIVVVACGPGNNRNATPARSNATSAKATPAAKPRPATTPKAAPLNAAALRQLMDQVHARKAEDIHWRDLNRDGGNPWALLAKGAKKRRAALAAFNKKHGGVLPRSFVSFASELGYPNVVGSIFARTSTGIWLGWVESSMGSGAKLLVSIHPEHVLSTKDGKRVAGFHFVDNPGDAPSHYYVAVRDRRKGRTGSLWLYVGGDAAHPDGVVLTGLATDFAFLAEAVLLGVTDPLLLPSKEAAAAQKSLALAVKRLPAAKWAKLRVRYGAVLAHVEAAAKRATTLPLKVPTSDNPARNRMDVGSRLLLKRLAGLRKTLGIARP